jgi:hypothetical protein
LVRSTENRVRYEKLNVDYRNAICGMWEGMSTGSEGSEFDDGENHRWEYLLDGTFNYYAAEHDSIQVTLNGSSALMIGRSRVTAAVYGGGKHSWRLQGDFTLRKENGTWKFTGSRASTY